MRPRVFRATNVVIGLLCLMYFLTYLDRVNISTVIASNEFLKEIPLSKVQMGLVFSAFAYPYLVFQVIGGWVADKFGPRKALMVCGIIWAGATLATGLVHGIVGLFVARVILGFGEGATFPTATRAMSFWTPKERRGFAQGLTHAFSRLGNSLTPWFVAILIVSTSWRGSFIVIGVISIGWALVWFLYFRDDPSSHRSITPAELASLPPYGAKKAGVKVPWSRLVARMVPVTVVKTAAWLLAQLFSLLSETTSALLETTPVVVGSATTVMVTPWPGFSVPSSASMALALLLTVPWLAPDETSERFSASMSTKVTFVARSVPTLVTVIV